MLTSQSNYLYPERDVPMTPRQPLYLSCAETAKRVRKTLHEAFPAVKFTVRSDTYTGGASIDVKWTDGPTVKQVQAVCHRFEGATLDAITGYKGPQTHIVNGQTIQYGADFIFPQRILSTAFLTCVAQAYCRRYRRPMPPIREQSTGAYIPRGYPEEEEIMRLAYATTARPGKLPRQIIL